MSLRIPRLLITPGDPAGIGPEICIKIASLSWDAELVFIVDPTLFEQYAKLLNCEIKTVIWSEESIPSKHQAGVMNVFPVTLKERVCPGELSTLNSHYVVETLTVANDLLIQKKADALVTGPVHKAIINEAGITFSGHTEFLADKSSASQVVMMLVCAKLRVALATTHLPLREIADAIDQQLLIDVITVLHKDMKQKFHIDDPVIHVCGLNPHAGESGQLGTEEIEIIEPVLEQLRAKGYKLIGPLPADTALTNEGIKGADVTLAMYHDQGLPVLKYAGFGDAVNITLGLPYLRVSVDHGTALDLAGKGIAKEGSLISAINQALLMINQHDKSTTGY